MSKNFEDDLKNFLEAAKKQNDKWKNSYDPMVKERNSINKYISEFTSGSPVELAVLNAQLNSLDTQMKMYNIFWKFHNGQSNIWNKSIEKEKKLENPRQEKIEDYHRMLASSTKNYDTVTQSFEEKLTALKKELGMTSLTPAFNQHKANESAAAPAQQQPQSENDSTKAKPKIL